MRIETHSINEENVELMTVVWTFPRSVLAEANTHRTLDNGISVQFYERMFPPEFSKNSSSSRAIPTNKFLEQIRNNPYIPEFGYNKKGMQADETLSSTDKIIAEIYWREARDYLIQTVEKLQKLNIHKQDVNRLLEPFGWMTQILTGDGFAWNNFFALRCHEDAHPGIRKPARELFKLYKKSQPKFLKNGEWHLPFVCEEEKKDFFWIPRGISKVQDLPDIFKISVARCAWVSYQSHDGDSSPEKIDRTIKVLIGEGPVHASPFEHQATPSQHGTSNFHYSWYQLRKCIPREKAILYSPSQEEIEKWT